MNGYDLSVPQVPQVPRVQVPRVPYVPSVPSVPTVGNLGSFNNAVQTFIDTTQQEFVNPFNDPNRYRSLGDVLLSRKLYNRDQNTSNFLEDALAWFGDNVIGNIPIVGGYIDDFIDDVVEVTSDVYDTIKEVPIVGDVVSLPEHLGKYAINFPERLINYAHDVWIEPWEWGGPKMALMSILNAAGKDLDLITGANLIKSIAIPITDYVLSNGKRGTLNIFDTMAKSLGLDEEAGLTHYEWNTGGLKIKEIPILGDVTQALVDLFGNIKDIPILGLLYDVATVLNEASAVDFILEIASSPDTYITAGASGALDALLKKVVKQGSPLLNLSDALKKATNTATDILTLRKARKALIADMKAKGITEGFTDYYYNSIISNLNNPTFIKNLTDNEVDVLIKNITNATTDAEKTYAKLTLKKYLKENVEKFFKESTDDVAIKGLQHSFEIAERWHKAENFFETLKGFTRYNNPIYTATQGAKGAKAFYNYVVSKYNARKLNKASAVPKNSYYYNNYILTKEDKEVVQNEINLSLKTYINNLPKELRDISPETFLEYYDDAVAQIMKTTDYINGALKENDIHRLAIKELLNKLEKVYDIKISDNIKRMLTELNISDVKLPKTAQKVYQGYSEFIDKLRDWSNANKINKYSEMSDISKYFNDYTSALAGGFKTNYNRLKDIKENLITTGHLADYKKFFNQAQPDVADHAIKEFEHLLDLMGLTEKDLRTVDAILDFKTEDIDILTRAFRKKKLGDKGLYDILEKTLTKRYNMVVDSANMSIYKSLFKNSILNIDDVHYHTSLQDAAKSLFGETVYKQIHLDINQRISAALEAYGVKISPDQVDDFIKTSKGVYAKIDNAGHLDGRRIVAGAVERQQNAIDNLATSFKTFFNYKEYIEYIPYKDTFFYEEYKAFSNELIDNISKTAQILGRNEPRFNVIKTDIIPLYKRILKRIDPTELTEVPTEKQVADWIREVILDKYTPDDLIVLADKLQEARIPMFSLIDELQETMQLTNDLTSEMTSTALRQFSDFINTLTSENVYTEIKKVAEATDAVYNLKLANRLHQAYTMAIITKHDTLYNSLKELIEPTILNNTITNVISVCLTSSDESIRSIGKRLAHLLNQTKGFFNYSDFYVDLDTMLKHINTSEDLKTIINNELQNIITTSSYTAKYADKITDADVDKIIDQLENKVMMSVGSHKFINNLTETKVKEIVDNINTTITRDLRTMGIRDVDVIMFKSTDPAHRFQFRVDTTNANPETIQQISDYLQSKYRYTDNPINILYEESLENETGNILNSFYIEGSFFGELTDIEGHSLGKDYIEYIETGLPFALADTLDEVRIVLNKYINKQKEASLPLFSFYSHNTLDATKLINDEMQKLLEYLNSQKEFSSETVAPYLFNFLNMFQGTGKTRKTFEDFLDMETLYGTTDDMMLNTVLTEAWDDIDAINNWLKDYGVTELDNMSPGVSNALYDVVVQKIGEETQDTVADGVLLNALLDKPSTVARIQTQYLKYKRNAKSFKKAPENIAVDRVYFHNLAIENESVANFILTYTKKENIQEAMKALTDEDLVDLKYVFKNTDLSRSLTQSTQSRSAYKSLYHNYSTLFKEMSLEDLDINYVRTQLAFMFRDAEFASQTIPMIQSELYEIFKTKKYNKDLIDNIVVKLGGTEQEALTLYQKLNRSITKGSIDKTLYDLYYWCLTRANDEVTTMSWYAVVVNNKPLYQTMFGISKSQKAKGDAAYTYLSGVESEVLKDTNTRNLIINGAGVEALAMGKTNLERGGVFYETTKPNKNASTLIEKVQNSHTIAASISSGKASYDTLTEINNIFEGTTSKYNRKQTREITYNMEQLIDDMQVQALFSLDNKTLAEFIRDNYGLVYIQGTDLELPWTKAQLKKVGLDFKQVDNEFIIYNIDKNYTYSNVVATKQYADIKIDAFRDTLDKVNPLKEKLNVYTNEAYTPFGDDLFIPRTITRDSVETLLEKFEIQEAYLNPDFFYNNYTRMDNITFMTSEWRALSQPWGLDYKKALTTYYQDIIKNENMKVKYIDAIFRYEEFSPEIYKELLTECTNKEVAEFFKENKLTGVVVTTSTKGDVVFPKVDTIKIRNKIDLQTLIDHPDIAAVVPRTMAMNILIAINDHAADSRLVDTIRLVNYLWKVGIVAKPGQVLRNFYDTYVKNINETGRSVSEEYYKRKVAGSLNNLYDEIYEKCFEQYGDIQYKHLDMVLDSMLKNSNLTENEKIIIKNAMSLVHDLNKAGAIDSDIMVLKKVQRQFNERYLRGFEQTERQLINLVQELPGIKQMLDANNYIERTARLSLALDEIQKTGDIASVIEKIDRVHFNYADKSPALQKAELFIPFAVYPRKNLAYWLNGGFKANDLFRLMYIGLRQSWSNEYGDFGQMFYRDQKTGEVKIDPFALQAMSSGNLRVGDYIIKTGWSYLDAMNLVLNPLDEAQSRSHPLLQYATKQDAYSGYSMIPFVGPELYRLSKGQGINRTLTGSMFTNDYTLNTAYKKNAYYNSIYKKGYYKYPKSNRNLVRYGRYPKVSYKAMHGSNRGLYFRRYYGKIPNNIYYDLYKKNKYAIVNLRKWQAQNPSYYWSNAKNIVSNAKRIRAIFR